MTKRVLVTGGGTHLSFKCPGCGDTHTIPVQMIPGRTTVWSWNQSIERPTLTPSIDVKSGHYASSHKPGDPCWCSSKYEFNCYHCHSHVVDGKIIFCTDSSHKLAGQTVDLMEIIS